MAKRRARGESGLDALVDVVERALAAELQLAAEATGSTEAATAATLWKRSPEEVEQAVIVRNDVMPRVASLAQLIAAGFDPAAACKILGLPPIKHTGVPPVTGKEPEPGAPEPTITKRIRVAKAAATFDAALQQGQVGEVWAELDQLVEALKTVWYAILFDPETEDKQAACGAAAEAFGLALESVLTDWLGGDRSTIGKRALEGRIRHAAMGLLRQRARLHVEAHAADLQKRGVLAQAAWSEANRTTAATVYMKLAGIPEPPAAG